MSIGFGCRGGEVVLSVSGPRRWSLALVAAMVSACSAAVSTSGVKCADMVADSTSDRPLDRRANTRTIVLPAFANRRLSGQVTIHPFVNRRGRVDSVRLAGTIPESFHPEIRRAVAGMRYRPAERDGCPVAAWADSMVMTFR